jgi:hydrogenase expression/formation protein HypD
MDLAAFRDPSLAKTLIDAITDMAPDRDVNLMEVCGTHTMAIARGGFASVLPEHVHLLSGPGCPVCVTANRDIDSIIALARMDNVTITTFGDMMRVPGSTSSLLDEKAAGHDVRIVYSPLNALDIARENPDREVVFVGVGFETTTPLIAAAIRHADDEGLANFSVLCAHKTMPNTLNALVNDPEVRIDALILPGHVCTITGTGPFQFLARDYHVPGVVTGFEPVDVLQGIAMLVRQLVEGRADIEIAYERGARREGNPTAIALVDEVFEPCDATWRGMGVIPNSGMRIRDRYASFDAVRRLHPEPEPTIEPSGCRCGDVLRGVIRSEDCPLFGSACTPEHPIGPCMVSSEGSCAAHYRYHSL